MQLIDCFKHEDDNGVADVIPCALRRGGRDNFARKENLARPGGLAKLRLVLGRIQGDTPGVPSRGEVLREGKPSRGSPGLESLVLSRI